MKRVLPLLLVSLLSIPAWADQGGVPHNPPPAAADNENNPHLFPLNPAGSNAITNMPDEDFSEVGGRAVTPRLGQITGQSLHLNPIPLATNLTYHGGDVINTARLVCIFWGPTWASGGSDNARATNIQSFRNQFGTSSHYAIITQYSDGGGAINTTNLAGSQPDWFDTSSALPSNGNVSDSVVRQEVDRYRSRFGTSTTTVYEVFLPKFVPGTSTLVYSSSGSSTSCGGPSLAYCAYHSSYSTTSGNVKYSIEPYPSCSGCQVSGWLVVQNMEHFVTHETREAVTDPNGNAWFDGSGQEADDKCAWISLFLENGFGYQPEWSNRVSGCVQ